jgi:hypothetical protein
VLDKDEDLRALLISQVIPPPTSPTPPTTPSPSPSPLLRVDSSDTFKAPRRKQRKQKKLKNVSSNDSTTSPPPPQQQQQHTIEPLTMNPPVGIEGPQILKILPLTPSSSSHTHYTLDEPLSYHLSPDISCYKLFTRQPRGLLRDVFEAWWSLLIISNEMDKAQMLWCERLQSIMHH